MITNPGFCIVDISMCLFLFLANPTRYDVKLPKEVSIQNSKISLYKVIHLMCICILDTLKVNFSLIQMNSFF